MKRFLASASTVVLAAILTSGVAMAQEAENKSDGLAEIVVTAQKRAENVQDVPISITAFSGETLAAAGIEDVRDLRRITPNLNFTTAAQTANTRIQIRGVGTSGNSAIEPSVASFVDGVYIPRIGSLLAGLNDISSVEVLRGPQGTLFGRNASMGAVVLHTTDPKDEFEGRMQGSYGSYNRVRLSGIVNIPVSDTAAFRFSSVYYQADGFGRNELDGSRMGKENGFSIRGAFRWEPNERVKWVLRGDFVDLGGDGNNVLTVVSKTVTPTIAANWLARTDPDGAGPLTGSVPILDDTYNWRVRQDTGGTLDDKNWGVVSDLNVDLGGDFAMRIISSYRDWHNFQYQENTVAIPGSPYGRPGGFDSHAHSEEFQFISPDDMLNGHLKFVAGVYYFEEDYWINEGLDLKPPYCNVLIRNAQPTRLAACLAGQQVPGTRFNFFQNTKSLAGYGEMTLMLGDKFSITGGIRATKDEKVGDLSSIVYNSTITRANETTALQLDASATTYRLNATYKPTDDIMVFASYATGFKSGGFDSSPPTTAAVGSANRTFLPERTKNWELGVKSSLFDRKLIFNATLYRTRIDDLQFRTFDGLTFRTRNNGKVQQQGVEVDIVARPIPELTLTLGTAYLDSKYLDFRGAPNLPAFGGTQDLTGTRLPFSPKWQGAASAAYEGRFNQDLKWSLRADLGFSSAANVGAQGDNNPDAIQPGYALLGARFGIGPEDGNWEVAVAGQNLTNKAYCVNMAPQVQDQQFLLRNTVTGGTVLRCTLNEPRQVNIEFTKKF
ncbi:MAG: TonB-dependent receptor [Sphingomonadaceae bacterium]|nr:TonB-dependent receptor [Sphingomonadaceae bacterium]